MQQGVIAQMVAITSAVLIAYYLGLYIDEATADTMAFATLSMSELLRAFTARSERYPLLKIGIFSNKIMNLAVISSMILLLAVIYIPFLNPIFNTIPLSGANWLTIIPLLFIPSLIAEAIKYGIYNQAKRS